MKASDPLKQIKQFEEKEIHKERSTINIFVVDDEKIIRTLLIHVLTKEGYNVVGFGRAEEALEEIIEGKADIVITDLMMIGLGGMDLLKKIKETTPNVDVIVMTGYSSVETAVESMKLGAVDYITKPLSIDHIAIIVNKTLERRILKRKAGETLFYKRLSLLDGMTELFNHRFFQELLDIEISRAERESKPLSLIMLDIDDFKVFNDQNGHQGGDAALIKVSWILKSNSRNCDFVARYGGEEFAIIAPNIDKKYAEIWANRIRKAVEETKFENEESLPRKTFSVSIGVATYSTDASNKKELIKKADQALYKAKKSGKNKVCVYNCQDEYD